VYAKLGSEIRAVEFHRAFVDAKVCGDLFVEFALNDVPEHLALAISQQLERLAQRQHARLSGLFLKVLDQGAVHGSNQVFLGRTFG
jgi:hypothetical protein